MKKRTKYTEGPIVGKLRIVPDFLPPPEEFAAAFANVKITITLSRSSVDYFKRVAKRQGTPYQKLIRTLLDTYVATHPR